jgi:hypothetical protein
VHSEIRAHLAAMKGSKLGFVEQHLKDPRVASPVLGAPPFLSGLTDAEVDVVRKRIEQQVAPEIAEARDATLKALEQAEQGWQRAINKIGEPAGLTKAPEGAEIWVEEYGADKRSSSSAMSGSSITRKPSQLPEPLESVREREERQRDRVRELGRVLIKWASDENVCFAP